MSSKRSLNSLSPFTYSSAAKVSISYAGPNVREGSRLCENSNTRAAVHEFQSVFGIFGHYRPGRAKKFAPDAPFSDNFRVFTRSGPLRAIPGHPRADGRVDKKRTFARHPCT